jgi:hypothetical protein
MNLGRWTKCDEIQSNDFVNLATTKAAAKLKLKFNKLASWQRNKLRQIQSDWDTERGGGKKTTKAERER